MKVIAVEEHFAAAKVPGIVLENLPHLAPNTHKGSAWAADPTTLFEIGEKRIANMDKDGISMQIISTPLAQSFPANVAVDYCRKVNDYLYERIAEHPDRFMGFASVPTAVPEACADELERCIKELGFFGVLIGNRVNGGFLSEPQFDPLLAKAEELGVPVFIHPGEIPQAIVDACYSKGLSHDVSASFQRYGYGWHVDTSVHFLNLILTGAFDRHPNLQVILGHWGEVTPYFMERLDTNLPPELTGLAHEPSYYFLHNLYITSSGMWSPECLDYCVKYIGVDRILFSQDYPFGNPDRMSKILYNAILMREDREKIAHGNVEQLFKNRSRQFKKLGAQESCQYIKDTGKWEMHEIELVSVDRDAVVVAVAGRIDTENEQAFYDDLKNLRKRNPQGTLEINCKTLTYISSAGLRAIVSIAKEEPSGKTIRITETAAEIYEIFRVTGFTKVMDVSKALREISVQGCPVIGARAVGTVYKLDNETIVKVYSESMPEKDIVEERRIAEGAFHKGINTAISFDMVRVGDQFGVVYEYINSALLSELLKEKPEKFDEYAGMYIDAYNKLHTTVVSTEECPSCKDKYLRMIDSCAEWYSREELDKIKKVVASIPERHTLIHGDFHPGNLMLQDGKLLLIDMGDVSYGHPIFDYMSTAFTLNVNPAIAEKFTGVSIDLLQRLWNATLPGIFPDKSAEEVDRLNQQIQLMAKFKFFMVPAFGKNVSPQAKKINMERAKTELLPMIDSLVGMIDW